MKKRAVSILLARQTGMRIRDMKIVVDKFFDLLTVELLRGEPVIIKNFGYFKVYKKSGYTYSRGMFKGEHVPSYTHVTFKMSGLLKQLIRERDAKRNSASDNKTI